MSVDRPTPSDSRPALPQPPQSRLRLRLGEAVAALLALSALAVAVVPHSPLGEALWPESRVDRLRREAETALRAGRLSAEDGSGARELYAAALAIDPDRPDLREGLARVAEAAVTQADAALARGDLAEAQRQLALARALSARRARVEAVATALRNREAAVAGIDALLARAAAALAAGRLDKAANEAGAPHGSGDAALPLYRQVLRLQPDRTEALEGREDAIAALLEQAQAALRRDDLAGGATRIAAAAGYHAGHPDLPDAKAALTAAVERARRLAEADRRAGRLTRAAERYGALRATGLEPTATERGLVELARAYALRAADAAADFDNAQANADLAAAEALLQGVSADAMPRTELDAARAALARAERAERKLSPPPLTAAGRRRLRALLDDAAAAEARGDWLTPPGDSAYDLLRAARTLAPDNADVRRASARLLPRARACVEQELQDNRLRRAQVCLDAWVALAGDGADRRAMRRRLAERWLAMGDQRLGAGDVAGAAASLAAARALDPGVDGLDAFAERVKTAEGER